ncbi:DNA-binding protein [Pseudomonas sp. MWU13-2100]|uniref:helix-turn-helix domain-containing transcriptional regulator n=1 Tax=Pseudomonas sp. MWU13-2100 TaxID=2935075 RepID=UPI00200CD0A1|nr:transcriptional regulator [Pseudomonas sp. MWU13-2100]
MGFSKEFLLTVLRCQLDYLNACLEEAGDDSAFMANALAVLARACGMPQVAQDVGMLLSEDDELEFRTFLKVIDARGVKLQVSAIKD